MATATFDPPPIALARYGASVRVVRFNKNNPIGYFTPLPNVVCIGVDHKDGPEPRVARLRYKFDTNSDPIFPQRVEDVLGYDRSGRYIVGQDDEICVVVDQEDNGFWIMFHGFAKVPQGDIGKGEHVSFQAIGVEEREWDTPLEGAYFRNSLDPTIVSDVTTELPARFNPDGLPNGTPNGAEAGTGTQKYPTFLDSNLVRTPDKRAYWTISSAAKYILARGNLDETYTQTIPDFDDLDDIFCALTPTNGDFFDPSNPLETTTDQIECQDIDVQGDPWPVAMSKLISPHGFDFTFRLEQTSSGTPFTYFSPYRIDNGDKIAPKTVNLQEIGATFDPGASNVESLSIARDPSQIANRIVLDTQLVRYECSLVLAPGFTPSSGDVGANQHYFDEGDPQFTGANMDKYRVWTYSEAGDGYWDFPTSSFVTKSTSLDAILGPPITDPDTGKPDPEYAVRRRKPLGKLFVLNNGKPVRAILSMSSDYNQPIPGPWDRSGHWQDVEDGLWALLPDRIGIRFTCKSIWDKFNIGQYKGTSPDASINTHGLVDLVLSQNAPVPPGVTTYANSPRVYFRLTCVIEGDQTPGIVAERRAASGSKYAITRRVDTKDRFFQHKVDKSSHLNTTGRTFITADSNYDKASAFADAMRGVHENARFAGSISIPRITTAYQVGDKISMVRGRNISFRTNGGASQGEAAQYPVVVGISWDCEGHQATRLTLADRRAEPAPAKTRGHDYDD